jgi:hypothetical protein
MRNFLKSNVKLNPIGVSKVIICRELNAKEKVKTLNQKERVAF